MNGGSPNCARSGSWPLDLLAVVGLSGVKREVRQQRLRLPGGQVNRRRADARLEPAEERNHEGSGVDGTCAPCALSTGRRPSVIALACFGGEEALHERDSQGR
jgi:hypothetical protein